MGALLPVLTTIHMDKHMLVPLMQCATLETWEMCQAMLMEMVSTKPKMHLCHLWGH